MVMDTDNDPLYNRRLRGTPSHRFTNKWSAIIVGLSLLTGVGCHFLIKSLPNPPKGEEPTLWEKIEKKIDEHHTVLRASLIGGATFKMGNNSNAPDNDEVEK